MTRNANIINKSQINLYVCYQERAMQMPVYLNCLAESSNKDRAKATNDREKNVRDISTTHSRQTVMKKQKKHFLELIKEHVGKGKNNL